MQIGMAHTLPVGCMCPLTGNCSAACCCACYSDGDGVISVEDLDLSLGHVSICCPTSRCVYRTRQDVVQGLISKLGFEGNRWGGARGPGGKG